MTLSTKLRDVQLAFDSLRALEVAIADAADLVVDRLRAGGRILVCGNGGSASEAQHFVNELVGRYRSDRQPLPAVFLGGDTGLMTCIANDFAWTEVFARPLRAFARPGDLLVCLSTSGNSANVISALAEAEALAIESVALLGHSGGEAAALATHAIVVPSSDTARIQEVHLFLIHLICDVVEDAFDQTGGRSGNGRQ